MSPAPFDVTPEKQASFPRYMYHQLTTKPEVVSDVDLRGKTALVTGSNCGVELETSRQLLDLGISKLILAVRNEEKGRAAATDLSAGREGMAPGTIEVWKIDLSDYDSDVPILAALDAPGKLADNREDRMFVSKLLGQYFVAALAKRVPASVAVINAASPGTICDSQFPTRYRQDACGSDRQDADPWTVPVFPENGAIIPQPTSQSEYQTQINLGQDGFSSMALSIELSRIRAELVLPCNEGPDEGCKEMLEQGDSRISSWLRRVPRWKMDLVDPDGDVDVVLFHAVAFAHIYRLWLRQPADRHGLNLREYFPLGPAQGPDRKGQAVKRYGWKPHSIDIQAANSFCDLFRYPFPAQKLRPVIILGTLRVALTYLDACVFLGLDSPTLREKINMLVQILTANGEIWPLAKKVADEIRTVAKEYLTPPRTSTQNRRAGSSGPEPWVPVASNVLHEGSLPLAPEAEFDLYRDLNLLQGWNANDTWPNLADVYPV
ncbi:Uu.00g031500.m01.CDS01 [Anthostomella pinea]|uniref:Uu.00g031500.m01.CDS01 n=1 Tax=Anthostomella pinea TaxID=933095 RepID=A0AAI8YD33_9PEZI|nr:Uu.00g031500.m01.CDS01 [Anthostomella pinea]